MSSSSNVLCPVDRQTDRRCTFTIEHLLSVETIARVPAGACEEVARPPGCSCFVYFKLVVGKLRPPERFYTAREMSHNLTNKGKEGELRKIYNSGLFSPSFLSFMFSLLTIE